MGTVGTYPRRPGLLSNLRSGEMQMIFRKIALAVASAMVLALATEIIKMLERMLGNKDEGAKARLAKAS